MIERYYIALYFILFYVFFIFYPSLNRANKVRRLLNCGKDVRDELYEEDTRYNFASFLLSLSLSLFLYTIIVFLSSLFSRTRVRRRVTDTIPC